MSVFGGVRNTAVGSDRIVLIGYTGILVCHCVYAEDGSSTLNETGIAPAIMIVFSYYFFRGDLMKISVLACACEVEIYYVILQQAGVMHKIWLVL